MNLLASEWLKTRSLRTTWILAAATIVVTAAVTLLGIGGLVDDWQTALPADFDPVGNSLKGILVGQILIATLGAQTMTSEYATGQIISSLAITPRRGALLAAKATISALVALVAALVAVACSYVAGHAALTAAGLPTAALTDPATLRALLCATVYLALTGLLGLGFGTITRSGTGALAIIVTIALLVPALAPGLPGVLGETAAAYWPPTAGQSSYTNTGTLPPLAGIAIMTVFTLWTMLAAHLTLKARDV